MSRRAKLFRVHQSVGVLAVAFFTVTALTGLALTVSHLRGRDVPTASTGALTVPAGTLIDAAREEVPGADPVQLRFADPEHPSFMVAFDDPAHTRVYLDGSGEVLETRTTGRAGSVLALHTGRAGGVLGQLIAASSALALLLMGATGLAMARSRRRKKGDRVAQARARRDAG